MAKETGRKGSIWAQHKFAAFISYSRADKAVGELFQGKLERYKIPKPLIARKTLNGPVPKRLVPIFRDITDLGASGDLGAQINKALDNSAFLILLCSPHSAASKWVNAEVAHFKRKGAGDRIIPVIIDGEPVEHDPVTAPNGAFPPALMRVLGPDGELTGARAPEPLAPDMRPRAEGPDYAVLKTVAAMIGLEPDILSQRRAEMERRDRRRLRRIATVISVLAIAATGAAIAAYTQLIAARESQSRAFASLAWSNVAEGQHDRAARLALQAIPAGEGIALRTDARDGEDAMQAALWGNRTLGRLRSGLGGDTYQIAAMSLSDDTSTAAVIDSVGGLRVIDLEAGRVTMSAAYLARYAESDMHITYSAALSPDGGQLLTFALSPWSRQFDATACGLELDWEDSESAWFTATGTFWDTETGCPTGYLPGGGGAFMGGEFAWSPAGDTVIAARWANRGATVYAVPGGQALFEIETNPAANPADMEGWREPMPVYSANGAIILTKTGPFTAGLVRVQTGTQVQGFTVPLTTGEEWVDGVDALAFTGDETAVRITLRDDRVLYFDVETGARVPAPNAPVLREVSFMDQSGDWQRELRSLASPDAATPLWTRAPSAHGVSSDGSMLVTFDREVGAVRDLATGAALIDLVGHTAPVTQVLALPSKNRVLTGAENGEVRLWDVSLRVPVGQLSNTRILHALADGGAIVTDARRRGLQRLGADLIPVWEVETPAPVASLEFDPATQHLVAHMETGQAILVEALDGATTAELTGIQTPGATALSGDGSALVQISEAGEIVVSGADGALLATIPRPGEWRWISAAASADGSAVYGAEQNGVSAFETLTGERLWQFEGVPDETMDTPGRTEPLPLSIYISRMLASPDGTRLLVFFDNSPRAEYSADHGVLLDAATGQVISRLPLGNYEILNTARFSAAGDLLVTGSSAWIGDSPDIRSWDPVSGELLAFIPSVDDSFAPQDSGPEYRWALSPSSDRLLSAADTGEVRLWATRSGRLIADLSGDVPSGLEIEALALGNGRAWLTDKAGATLVIETPAELRGQALSSLACAQMTGAGIDGFSTDELAETDIPEGRRAPCETIGVFSPRLVPDLIGRVISRF